MSETNTQTNSALISLSRAAQITGYHQDYLGQLCRLGKLSAIKVGRNWFTFPEALNKLSANELLAEIESQQTTQPNLEDQPVYQEATETSSAFDFSAPQVVQNVTVSQVEGLPISIRTIATPAHNVNTVQNILTSLRIESLQREVSELRQLLSRLMAEVAKHSEMLQNRHSLNYSESLKHSYISNFDFNAPYSRRNTLLANENEAEHTESQFKINFEPVDHSLSQPQPRYSFVAFVSAVAVMSAFALITYGIFSGQFFGSTSPQLSTIYYQKPIIANEVQPTVAGDTSESDLVEVSP